MSSCRYEAVVIEYAVFSLGAILVPLWPDLKKEELQYILQQTQAKGIFCETLKWVKQVKLPFVIRITKKLFTGQSPKPICAQNTRTKALIAFTSGTTAQSKGCVYTHLAFQNQTRDFLQAAGKLFGPNQALLLSLAPGGLWFHLLLFYCVASETVIYFGTAETVLQDIHTAKATLFAHNPYIYRKIYEHLCQSNLGRASLCSGHLKHLLSGCSASNKEIAQFFKKWGLAYLDCYGLSETMSSTLVPPHSARLGTIGKPLPHIQFKVAKEGELLVKTPSLFSGYLHDLKKTKDSFIKGWFKTGDLASIDKQGYIHLKGRKKDLINLASGRLINPSIIEAKIKQCPYVSQAVLIGENRPFLVMLITLKTKTSHTIRQAIGAQLKKINKTLNPTAQVKAYHILSTDFSKEAGALSPALKLKRRKIFELYAKEIEQLFLSIKN
jgi:long-chain acyl-CoA synthetase